MKLADSQEWLLAKPWLEVHAAFDGGRAVRTWPCLTYGPDLDALVQAMSNCEDNAALLIGAASLGAYLLQQNYDLADAEMDGLFAFRIGDPESWDWARSVIDDPARATIGRQTARVDARSNATNSTRRNESINSTPRAERN